MFTGVYKGEYGGKTGGLILCNFYGNNCSKQVSISGIRQEDGIPRWRNTSSQKETESTLSIFQETVKKLEEAYYFLRSVVMGGKEMFCLSEQRTRPRTQFARKLKDAACSM